ncbi:MAG: hypothetical protein EPN41_02285 [Candidimonas sp.]|nr:MAG: hypothetical protein EPN41_02285 [Candidimonas sp.]
MTVQTPSCIAAGASAAAPCPDKLDPASGSTGFSEALSRAKQASSHATGDQTGPARQTNAPKRPGDARADAPAGAQARDPADASRDAQTLPSTWSEAGRVSADEPGKADKTDPRHESHRDDGNDAFAQSPPMVAAPPILPAAALAAQAVTGQGQMPGAALTAGSGATPVAAFVARTEPVLGQSGASRAGGLSSRPDAHARSDAGNSATLNLDTPSAPGAAQPSPGGSGAAKLANVQPIALSATSAPQDFAPSGPTAPRLPPGGPGQPGTNGASLANPGAQRPQAWLRDAGQVRAAGTDDTPTRQFLDDVRRAREVIPEGSRNDPMAAIANLVAGAGLTAQPPQPSVATTGTVDAPLGSPSWPSAFAGQLGPMVARLVGGGSSHVALALNPPALGPLQLAISVQGSVASLHFSSEHDAVNQALEQAMPILGAALMQHGLTLANTTPNPNPSPNQQNTPGDSATFAQSGFTQSDSRQPNPQQSREGAGHTYASGATGTRLAAADAGAPMAPVATRAARIGLVDERA